MARYTGPSTRIARKFGKQYSEMIKHSKEEITHLDNTGWKKRKKSEYAIQLMESKKLNILMDF
jgi:small subunit ribosomal protein S4